MNGALRGSRNGGEGIGRERGMHVTWRGVALILFSHVSRLMYARGQGARGCGSRYGYGSITRPRRDWSAISY